jgi:hypothetical protein
VYRIASEKKHINQQVNWMAALAALIRHDDESSNRHHEPPEDLA